MSQNDMNHMHYLRQVMDADMVMIKHKEATYRGSWKKRGGAGAYMVSARKIDRLENIAEKHSFDIFAALEVDMTGADGSALAELRDLRCYLALIEAEVMARQEALRCGGKAHPEQFKSGTPEDGGHHSLHEEDN
jgi:hypothetical protein